MFLWPAKRVTSKSRAKSVDDLARVMALRQVLDSEGDEEDEEETDTEVISVSVSSCVSSVSVRSSLSSESVVQRLSTSVR